MQKYANKPSKYERKTMQDLKYTKKKWFLQIYYEKGMHSTYLLELKRYTHCRLVSKHECKLLFVCVYKQSL